MLFLKSKQFQEQNVKTFNIVIIIIIITWVEMFNITWLLALGRGECDRKGVGRALTWELVCLGLGRLVKQ